MSYKDGMQALQLEMPDKIPRTEYSAHIMHWDLISNVTGLPVSVSSPDEAKYKASKQFTEAWDYGFIWNILPFDDIFQGKKTKMGHAEFQQAGSDFSAETSQLITRHEEVYNFDFFKEYGERDHITLVKDFNKDFDTKVVKYPDTVNMTGMYTTCMSGIIEILGWDMLLLAAGMNTKAFGDFMNRYTLWNLQYFKALAACKSPIVMVHDDIVWTDGPFLHPDFYRTYIFPNYKKLFQPLIEAGKTILYTSDGNYTQFIDDIAACKVSGFVLEPTTDMEYICKTYGKTHAIVGNADTRILLHGDKKAIKAEVKRCIELGRDCPGYFLAVGNHIPHNTPVDSCLWYNEFFEQYRKR